jgi:exosortase O
MTNKSSTARLGAQLEGTSARSLNMVNIAITGFTIAAWLCANAASLQWLFDALINTSALNLLLIGSIAIGLAILTAAQRNKLEVSALPVMRAAPLVLMWGTAIAAIALNWFIDLEQITVLLFLLGTYGLLGLFIAPSLWQQGMPIAALIACVVPFSLQFTSGLGFTVRTLTSHIVEHLLSMQHIAAISSHDIIVLENGIAHVDLPCSGLKSLWTGTLFLLLTTWLEKRKFGFKWLLVYAACLILLIAANVGRIMLLVVTNNVLQQPQLAQILHVPVGLIGFVGACGMSWLLLKFVPRYPARSDSPSQRQDLRQVKTQEQGQLALSSKLVRTKNIILIICLIGLALLPRPVFSSIPALALSNIHWSSEMQMQPLPLTETELEFFNSQATTKAEKQRFQFGNLSGSMLLVSSSSWRSHHAPELCFVGNGFKVDRMTQAKLAPDFPVRWLSLQDGKMSATYWLQSRSQTTDEFLARIWSDISRQSRAWVMVSILFDQNRTPEQPEINTFAASVRNAIAQALK